MAGGRDKKKMKRIATFVTKGFKEQLQRYAKRKGTTVSDMIRDLLKEELWSDIRFGVVSKPPPQATQDERNADNERAVGKPLPQATQDERDADNERAAKERPAPAPAPSQTPPPSQTPRKPPLRWLWNG